MLIIGHSAATAVNAGKVYFTQNPKAINYPQWIDISDRLLVVEGGTCTAAYEKEEFHRIVW